MAYQSRSAARSRAQKLEADLTESKLVIPDALVAWAQDTERQINWPAPYGHHVAALLKQASEAPLMPSDLERLLSRLDAIVSAAVAAGRSDLLVGFDFQTAEWLGLNIHAETKRGHLHIGPDPRTQAFEGAPEPPWTYAEARLVVEAREPAAVDLAWRTKELLLDVFPEARITSIEHEPELSPCVACGKPGGNVMMATDGGEYHPRCWAEMTAPTPEHLRELAKKGSKAR